MKSIFREQVLELKRKIETEPEVRAVISSLEDFPQILSFSVTIDPKALVLDNRSCSILGLDKKKPFKIAFTLDDEKMLNLPADTVGLDMASVVQKGLLGFDFPFEGARKPHFHSYLNAYLMESLHEIRGAAFKSYDLMMIGQRFSFI